jgi:hypothetical protein
MGEGNSPAEPLALGGLNAATGIPPSPGPMARVHGLSATLYRHERVLDFTVRVIMVSHRGLMASDSGRVEVDGKRKSLSMSALVFTVRVIMISQRCFISPDLGRVERAEKANHYRLRSRSITMGKESIRVCG